MTTKAVTDETLKHKTWVLKVFIDCKGCKKKVQKILKGVEGVYGTVVDAQQNTVTVTGDVDADTLIKKLARSGKHAELITTPEKLQEKNVKQSKPKGNGGEGKADTAEEDPRTGVEEDVKIPEAEETKDGGGKQGKKHKNKKKKKKQSGGGNKVAGVGDGDGSGNDEATMVVGSPVSTLQPFDPTAYHGYPMSTLQPLDPAAYYPQPVIYGMSHGAGGVMDPMRSSGDEYEDERSGCLIM